MVPTCFIPKRNWVGLLTGRKSKTFLEQNYEIVEARYYVGLKEGDEKMRSYLRYLTAIGFIAVTKPLKKIRLEDGENHPFVRQERLYIWRT